MKEPLDFRFTKVCYVDGLPFSIYESPVMKEALWTLHPAYKPPTRKAIAGPLLDKVYIDVKSKVNSYITSIQSLNVITDESTNINNSRIMNISIHTDIGSFYWLFEDISTT